jgi:hypothetical protein
VFEKEILLVHYSGLTVSSTTPVSGRLACSRIDCNEKFSGIRAAELLSHLPDDPSIDTAPESA